MSAPGGVVYSNNADNALEAFGADNVSAGYASESQTLTITLRNDIALALPIAFAQGAAGDTVVLELAGHVLTGARGENGSDGDACNGKDAIEFYPQAFDLEVKGPGSIVGGEGGIYESTNHYKYGMDGGMAVRISGISDEGYYGKLQHGIRVSDGAIIKGGDGASARQGQDRGQCQHDFFQRKSDDGDQAELQR